VEDLRVAVMGCVVNGPGESSTPTSASACRGRSRSRWRRSSSTGLWTARFAATNIVDEFKRSWTGYVERRFPAVGSGVR